MPGSIPRQRDAGFASLAQPSVQDLHQLGHMRMLEEPDVRVRHSQDLEWLYRSRAPLLLGMRIAGTFLFVGDEKHRTGKVRARLVSHREASHFSPEGTILVFQVQPACD